MSQNSELLQAEAKKRLLALTKKVVAANDAVAAAKRLVVYGAVVVIANGSDILCGVTGSSDGAVGVKGNQNVSIKFTTPTGTIAAEYNSTAGDNAGGVGIVIPPGISYFDYFNLFAAIDAQTTAFASAYPGSATQIAK